MSCKDCENRRVGCHGSCESYKAFKEKKEQANINRRNYYMTPRASFEISLKLKVRKNRPLGNMRVT